MLQTIEIEINASGHIEPIEPFIRLPVGRALLTLLDNKVLKNAESPTNVLVRIL